MNYFNCFLKCNQHTVIIEFDLQIRAMSYLQVIFKIRRKIDKASATLRRLMRLVSGQLCSHFRAQ